MLTLAFIINPGKIRLNIHDRQGKPFWLKVPNEPKNNRASKRATTVMLSKSEEFFLLSHRERVTQLLLLFSTLSFERFLKIHCRIKGTKCTVFDYP